METNGRSSEMNTDLFTMTKSINEPRVVSTNVSDNESSGSGRSTAIKAILPNQRYDLVGFRKINF